MISPIAASKSFFPNVNSGELNTLNSNNNDDFLLEIQVLKPTFTTRRAPPKTAITI